MILAISCARSSTRYITSYLPYHSYMKINRFCSQIVAPSSLVNDGIYVQKQQKNTQKQQLQTSIISTKSQQSIAQSKIKQKQNKIQPIKSKLKPIQTLQQLIIQRNTGQTPNFQLPQYQPSYLYLSVIKATKKGLYQNDQYSKKILEVLQRYKYNYEYIKIFMNLILPIDQMYPALNEFYKQITIRYLTIKNNNINGINGINDNSMNININKDDKKYNKQQLYTILDNLQRMLVEMRTQWVDQYWIMRDYTMQQKIAQLVIPAMINIKHQFDQSIYVKLTRLCNMLGVQNSNLGQHMLRMILDSKSRLKMRDIISILNYLSSINTFPYQYFYKNKRVFIETLESYNKFSTKKSFQSIKLLQLMISQNLIHSQKIIKRLQDILLQAIPSFDHEDISNVWYLCSRAKFAIYIQITQKILLKIEQYVPSMRQRQLCLVVRGFSRFASINQQQFKQRCLYILKAIKTKLSSNRAYELLIVDYMIQKLQKKQNIYVF